MHVKDGMLCRILSNRIRCLGSTDAGLCGMRIDCKCIRKSLNEVDISESMKVGEYKLLV